VSGWDVTYYDEEAGAVYRIAARRMTVRDGIHLGELEDAIAERDDLEGRALIALAHYYPLLACATRAAERASVDAPPETDDAGEMVLPEGMTWQALDLTEEQYLDLPDFLMWSWYTAVIRKNPQYDRSYEVLKKNLTRLMQRPTNAPGLSESAPAESDTASASSPG
jgi:hypothetical protein